MYTTRNIIVGRYLLLCVCASGWQHIMAIQKTVDFSPLSFGQLLVLLCIDWSVNAVVVDPCQPQFTCELRTKMGDPDNCNRYYECNFPDDPHSLIGRDLSLSHRNKARNPNRPRWIPEECYYGNEYFSIIEEKCVRDNRNCQSKCKDNGQISLKMDDGKHSYADPILEGTRVQFLCSFRYVMHGHVVPPEQLVWAHYDERGTNSRKQMIIASDFHPDDKGFFNYTMIFESITGSASGNIQCGVQYNGIFAMYSNWEYVTVWENSTLTALISPMSLTVFSYEKIVLKCYIGLYGTRFNFTWFKDGKEIKPSGDIAIGQGEYSRQSYLNTSAKFYKTSVQFSCKVISVHGYTLKPSAHTIREASITVFVINETESYCPRTFDEKHSMTWSLTKAGTTSIQPCDGSKELQEESELSGLCSRKCVLNTAKSAVWLPANCDKCVESTYLKLLQEIQLLEAGFGLEDQLLVAKTATELAVLTNDTDGLTNDTDGLTPGELNASLEIINRLTLLRRDNPNIAVAGKEISSIVQSISNLLEPINTESWKTLQRTNENTTPAVFLSSAEVYGKHLAKLNTETESKTVSIVSNNMVLEAWRFDQLTSAETNAISFPLQMNRPDEDWVASSNDRISVSTKSLRQLCNPGNTVNLWSSYFRNIENYLPERNYSYGYTGVIGSRVLSLSVESLREVESFSQPIIILLQHTKQYNRRMKKCVFWKLDSYGEGYWDDTGCSVISTSDTQTFCQCNHLTNFAILFSLSPSVDVALSIISTVGCSMSVAALILTVVVYALSWKIVKSDQAAVLLNLCIALIVANIIFLVGADKTSHQEGCKAVAVLLHYFFLAAFFMMLAEGIELLLYIIFVFHVRTKIETTMIIVAAWVLPLIVVAVSLGLTKTDGYSNSQSCWLSVENGLIWAFVGPALSIILVNFIILIFVLKRVSADRVPSSKNEKTNKIRGSIWNMAVICPILGIAWVFGVLSMSFHHIVFQYVFAVANSCQGLFIFIFHVLVRRKKGTQGSLIKDLLCCGRSESPSITSASGSDTAAKKLGKIPNDRLHEKKQQKETQISDSRLVYLSSETSEM